MSPLSDPHELDKLLALAYERAAETQVNACPPDVGRLLRALVKHIG